MSLRDFVYKSMLIIFYARCVFLKFEMLAMLHNKKTYTDELAVYLNIVVFREGHILGTTCISYTGQYH